MTFGPALQTALAASRAGGDLLRDELHRPDGPRGKGDKAPADTEAELRIRSILRDAHPNWGFLGEETGRVAGREGDPVWVVDPNDGTNDFVKGRRGSAVSIALVHEGRPVLGVVFAFAYPDSGGSAFHAVEGVEGVFANGAPSRAEWRGALGSGDVVLVSGGADRVPRPNLECCRPARFRAIPSIAHRLALVAAGRAAAATSLWSPKSWDYAAGHALIRAAGGSLVDERGIEPVYPADALGSVRRLFAGSGPVALELARRDWDRAFHSAHDPDVVVTRLTPGALVRDPRLLSRAHGALLGALTGDAIGTAWEAAPPGASARELGIARALASPRGLPGRLSDDGEMTIALARVLVERGFDPDAVLAAYREWGATDPRTMGATIRNALAGRPTPDSLANGALMRAIPLALAGLDDSEETLASRAKAEAALTHAHPHVGEASAAYVVAARHLLKGARPRNAFDAAHALARRDRFSTSAIDALVGSQEAPPANPRVNAGLVWIALQTAFHELLHSDSYEDSIARILDAGGDVDTNATIAGGLLGAALGREAIPDEWRNLVLSARPAHGFEPDARPARYWPTDALTLAERLLLSGTGRG
jgi:fructose-1,6-bisphosphatase/inositol monophosphatase family enzyme/ADP-ribosylglycohydrolase